MDTRTTTQADTAPPKPGTLLLVDDEENILSALRRLLRRDHYRILTAGSGAEGLQILAAEEVDVIVSDQRMPAMTGTEFLRKAREQCPQTIRIVLSGYTELESVTSAINEGAVYKFLTKPWDDEQLRANIAEAMHRKRVGDENRRLQAELKIANERLQGLLEDRQRLLAIGQASLNFSQETLAALPFGVIGVDSDGMVALANSAAQTLLADGLLGLQATDVLPAPLQAMLTAPTLTGHCMLGEQRLLMFRQTIGDAQRPRGTILAWIDPAHLEIQQ